MISDESERPAIRLAHLVDEATPGSDIGQSLIEEIIDIVFDQASLNEIANVGLLSRAYEIISESGCDEGYKDKLDRLQDRLARVRAIHDWLYALLDQGVGIDALLERLDALWQGEPASAGILAAARERLQTLRDTPSSPVDRLRNFWAGYLAELNNVGRALEDTHSEVELILDDVARRQDSGVQALFAEPGKRRGHVLGVEARLSVSQPSGSQVRFHPDMDQEARKAVREAATAALRHVGQASRYDADITVERAAHYEGRSLGLAVAIAVLTELQQAAADPYTAFTGSVSLDGSVGEVSALAEKLDAARRAGIRRVFVPSANVPSAADSDDLQIVPVSSLSEVVAKLAQPLPRPRDDATARIRAFQFACKQRGLQAAEPRSLQNGLQIKITDSDQVLSLNIYPSRQGTKLVLNPPGDTALHILVREIMTEVFGPTGAPSVPQHYTRKIQSAALRKQVEQYLRSLPAYEEKTEANCDYRLDFVHNGQRTVVKQYSSGTLTTDGAGDLPDTIVGAVDRLLGRPATSTPSAPPPAARGSSTPLATASLPPPPWVGTDESGKGDYFGPLVSAAVWVDGELEQRLVALGVRDSKTLSDTRNRQLAEQIRRVCHQKFAEVLIGPETYNQRYNEFRQEGKNLNSLLAWGHMKALEKLAGRVPCVTVIADQFGDEHYITERLRSVVRRHGLEPPRLIQMPKAEANIAVAAASVLARDRFLGWLERESRKRGLTLPKGASAAVVEVAREIVRRSGPDELRQVAKLHFKTTEQVLGGR